MKILPTGFGTLPLLSRLLLSYLLLTCSIVAHADYIQDRDLISLHYDHAPDRDDGHAAVSALAVVSSYGIQPHVVSGAYGQKNKNSYQNGAEAVMRAAWGSNWVNAHNNKNNAANNTANVWLGTLDNGGHIWIAEGGQADFTAAVIRKIKSDRGGLNTKQLIHVVQHSTWNENQSTKQDLDYVKANSDYIKIADGNGANGTADLNQKNANFVNKAKASRFGSAWKAAFNYLDPINKKLDFSDTVELLHILGISKAQVANVADFGNVFLSGQQPPATTEPVTPTQVVTPEPVTPPPTIVEPNNPAPDTTNFPSCSDAIVDNNGDGYGWENNRSCLITAASNTTPTVTPQPTSTSTPTTDDFPSCSAAITDDNGDGYGWENNRTCVITNSTPVVTPQTATPEIQTQEVVSQNDLLQYFPACGASATNNGDGYGWENNRTCIITDAQSSVANPTNSEPLQQQLALFPDCSAAIADDNGDGYGWENSRTCTITNSAATQSSEQEPQTTNQTTQSELLTYFPVCSSGITDNGDGFGWENNRSCVIVDGDSQPNQTQSVDTPYFPPCSDNLQINNGDGYGWEYNRTCVIQTQSATPDLTDYFPVCGVRVSDDNGDGYGWENNRTCLITNNQTVAADTQAQAENHSGTTDQFPVCTGAIFDDNGDGYGWENYRTCVFNTNGITFPSCSANVIDENGDGYGWENNRTCAIASTTKTITQPGLQHFPRCSSGVTDDNGDGFGWENNRSCLIVR